MNDLNTRLRKLTSMSLLKILLSFSLLASAFAEPFQPKFYAFQNGVNFKNPAATLKELGFDGISQVRAHPTGLPDQVQSFEAAGLKVLSIYLNVNDKPIEPATVQALANRDALIELTIQKMNPMTVEAVRQTAAMAKKLKIKVALYPHHGFAVATMPQAMDLIEKVNHPNLGVMFNLCHFLKNEDPKTIETTLGKAGSKLFAVSTCGADLGGESWNQLIQPLDKGDFPQERLFRALNSLKFSGPVGLQCYAIKGDKHDNLQKSMGAWKTIIRNLAK